MPDFIDQHTVLMDHHGFLDAVTELATLVEDNRHEHELQSHIQSHPYILSEQFAHCHHVFPRVRLGERFEADFFCLEIPSYGKEWIAVEIEPCSTQLVTKSGRRSAKLEHALQQVRDWRKWTTDNIDYARRPRDQSGLGLEDVGPQFAAEVIIGRRRDHTHAYNQIRKQIRDNERISVRSWDSVLDRARERALIYHDFAKQIFGQ